MVFGFVWHLKPAYLLECACTSDASLPGMKIGAWPSQGLIIAQAFSGQAYCQALPEPQSRVPRSSSASATH